MYKQISIAPSFFDFLPIYCMLRYDFSVTDASAKSVCNIRKCCRPTLIVLNLSIRWADRVYLLKNNLSFGAMYRLVCTSTDNWQCQTYRALRDSKLHWQLYHQMVGLSYEAKE